MTDDNRLALNRLALNRLALNRLALNRLALDGMAPESWQDGADELVATADGREILRYLAVCAFVEDDVLVRAHDGHAYEFPGLLGLAPKWDDRPLGEEEQELVSACVLAHVNAYGVPVAISLRAHHDVPSTEEERRAFPVFEGTFFGQIFDGELGRIYACQGSVSDAALAHSEDRALRACTDGSEDCDIVAVGSCNEVCEERHEEEGWSRCWADGRLYEKTISVYLFADDPSGQNERCAFDGCWVVGDGGGAAILDCNRTKDCNAFCTNGATCTIEGIRSRRLDATIAGARLGEVDCHKSKDCEVACRDGARCAVDCHQGDDCEVECRGGASCDVDCYRGKDCRVECKDGAACQVQCGGHGRSCRRVKCRSGASCTLSCRNTKDCDFAWCYDGASCLLECGDADDCEFAYCPAGATSCAGGVIACGRPCP